MSKPKNGWPEKLATIAVSVVLVLCIIAGVGEFGGWL